MNLTVHFPRTASLAAWLGAFALLPLAPAYAQLYQPVTPPTTWLGTGGNGHCYQVFRTTLSGVNWTTADAEATALGGYLATITSPAENAFVYSLIQNEPTAWNAAGGPWIGGQRVGGTWGWVVTPEAWWSNWATGQPDDGCTAGPPETRVHFANPPGPFWNDFPATGCMGSRPPAFVVEWTSACCTDTFAPNGGRDACDNMFSQWASSDHSNQGSSAVVVPGTGCGVQAPGMEVTLNVLQSSPHPPYGYAIAAAWSTTAVYDPSADCTFCLDNVSMWVDHIAINSGGSGQAVHPAIRQGGNIYALPQWQATMTPSTWTTMALGPTPITSFRLLLPDYQFGTPSPDVTCSAAPMQFGLLFRNSGASSYSTVHCYDNWRVHLGCDSGFQVMTCPGCAGCNGIPILGVNSPAVFPNPTFAVTLDNACPLQIHVFAAGFGQCPPIGLGILGAPNCTLCVCPDLLVAGLTDANGDAAWPIPLVTPSIIGRVVNFQAFVLASPFHATPGASVKIGG